MEAGVFDFSPQIDYTVTKQRNDRRLVSGAVPKGGRFMRLRIGLLNDSFPPTIDGVAGATLNYALHIQQNHGQATVITPRYPHVTDHYPFEVYRYISLPTTKTVGYRTGNPFSPVMTAELKNHRFHLLHTHCPFASSTLARVLTLKRADRVPVVFTYHTKFDIDIDKRVKNIPMQKIAKRFILANIRQADEVWVVSSGAADSLRQLGYTGKYRVMPNGTDFARGHAPKELIDDLDRVYRLKPEVPVLLYIGRMMWYKNLHLILDGLRLIKEQGIPFQMLFVGDGTDRAAAEQYALDLGLRDCVQFVGAIYDRERVRAFTSRASLLVFPSTYDTSGLVIREAAACDCPALLVRGSCAAEGVDHEVSGFLCEENAEDLARVLAGALADRERLANIGKNAGETVYLSWQDAVAHSYARYEEIVRGWPYKNRDYLDWKELV